MSKFTFVPDGLGYALITFDTDPVRRSDRLAIASTSSSFDQVSDVESSASVDEEDVSEWEGLG